MASHLTELLSSAGLADPISVTPLSGRGFDNTVHRITLADGQQVILRRFREPRPPEHERARFLMDHRVPAPAFLAGSEHASLHAFVPGVLLGDLIETGMIAPEHWRAVGRAYRQTHDIRFPPLLTGNIEPDRVTLRANDPMSQLHGWIDGAVSGLKDHDPVLVRSLPALHDVVDRAAVSLRRARTSLGHGDINMWNVIVDGARATLIDWDYPAVRDPALEIALLDKHASLFNWRGGQCNDGLDPAFFEGYGRPATEPNTSIHRVVATLQWAIGSDWAEFERDPTLPESLKARARNWRATLWGYVDRLPEHIVRLQRLV